MINFPVAAPASFALAGGVVLLAVFFSGSRGHEKLLRRPLNQILTTAPPPPTWRAKDVSGNDTDGITGIPSTVRERGVVRRAGLGSSTQIVYPGSGREDG